MNESIFLKKQKIYKKMKVALNITGTLIVLAVIIVKLFMKKIDSSFLSDKIILVSGNIGIIIIIVFIRYGISKDYITPEEGSMNVSKTKKAALLNNLIGLSFFSYMLLRNILR